MFYIEALLSYRVRRYTFLQIWLETKSIYCYILERFNQVKNDLPDHELQL